MRFAPLGASARGARFEATPRSGLLIARPALLVVLITLAPVDSALGPL